MALVVRRTANGCVTRLGDDARPIEAPALGASRIRLALVQSGIGTDVFFSWVVRLCQKYAGLEGRMHEALRMLLAEEVEKRVEMGFAKDGESNEEQQTVALKITKQLNIKQGLHVRPIGRHILNRVLIAFLYYIVAVSWEEVARK